MIFYIYKIEIRKFIYIGSTKDFTQRKQMHKQTCNNPNSTGYNSKVYQVIRGLGGWNNCVMIPIEKYECDSKLDCQIREEQLRKEYNASLNTYKSHRSLEEYKKDFGYDPENYKRKVMCQCGIMYPYANITQHRKSKKHIEYINNLDNEQIIEPEIVQNVEPENIIFNNICIECGR